MVTANDEANLPGSLSLDVLHYIVLKPNVRRSAAARVKLRKLAKEQAAKEAAAASKSLAERSPHAKEVTCLLLRNVLYKLPLETYRSRGRD